MAQSILSNTAVASLGRVVNMALGIVLLSAITKYLGTARYGTYTLLLAYGVALQTAADFGLYLTLAREIGRHPHRQQQLVSWITSLRLLLLFALFSLAVFIGFFVPAYRPLLPAFVVLAAGFIVQSLSQLLMGVYQAHGVVWRATIGDIVGRVIQLAGVLLFPLAVLHQPVFAASPVFYMAVAFTVGLAGAYLIHGLLVPAVQPFRLTASWEQWRRIGRASLPLGLLLLVNIIYFRIDTVMLSFFWPQEEVGLYGLAYHIIERGLFFPAMFGGMLLPRLSGLVTKTGSAASSLLNQSLCAVLLLALPLAGLIAVYAGPLVTFLSGNEFAAAGPLLTILSLALFVMFFGNIFGFVLVALREQRRLLFLYIALALGNVIANLIFIPSFGAYGAAVTTVITEAVAAGAAGVLVYKHVPFRIPIRFVAMAAGITLAVVLVAAGLPEGWHILVRGGIAAALFGALAYGTGMLDRRQFNLLLT